MGTALRVRGYSCVASLAAWPHVCALGLVLLLMTRGKAHATVIASLHDASGDVHSVTTLPGDQFDLVVHLNTGGDSLLAASVRLLDLDSSGLFRLNSATFASPWSTSGDDILDPSPQSLTSANSYMTSDIGSLASDLMSGTGSSLDLLLVTLHMQTSITALPGTYHVNVANVVAGNVDGDPLATQSGGVYSVIVVPEPSSLALLTICGLTCLRRHGHETI